MRSVLAMSSLALVAACSNDAEVDNFSYQSTLSTPTQGVVIHDDGDRGHAGMFGTNCPFETVQGSVTGDYDLPEENEIVRDTGPSFLGHETVTLTIGSDVYLLQKWFPGGQYDTDERVIAGLRDIRMSEAGLVAMVDQGGECGVSWQGWLGEDLGSTTIGDCVAFDVDAHSGAAVVATPGGTKLVEPDLAIDAEVTGDLVAWDAAAGVAYIATRGESTLNAVQADGTVRWSVDLGHPVMALADAGQRAAAAVILEKADGTGVLGYIDGASGSIVAWEDTPQAALDVTVSGDGTVVGMVRPNEVHFFKVSQSL